MLTALVAFAIAPGIKRIGHHARDLHFMSEESDSAEGRRFLPSPGGHLLRPFDEDRLERAPIQWTWRDVDNLLRMDGAPRQVGMFESWPVTHPAAMPCSSRPRGSPQGLLPHVRAPLPLRRWLGRSRENAAEHDRPVARDQRVFGGEDSGEREANDRALTVVGALDDWDPVRA